MLGKKQRLCSVGLAANVNWVCVERAGGLAKSGFVASGQVSEEMEAVEMLKRSLLALTLCGMLASAAGAAQVFVLDTGHPDGPNVLQLGVETEVRIMINKDGPTTAPLIIGGIVFDFSSPNGALNWDLDGDDNASSPTWFPTESEILDFQENPDFPLPPARNPNINDDGFWFAGILDGTLHPNSIPGNFEDPNIPYFALHSPPQTALGGATADAFRIPNTETLMVATLKITGKEEGLQTLVLGDPNGVVVNQGFVNVDMGGTHTQVLNVVPEPATLALLVLGGGLTVLRRRR